MKLVIVEDEIRIREGLKKLLHKFYPHITGIWEAKSGEEGLRVIRETDPDVVITDIRMEPLDGLEMLKVLLTKEKRKFKTIILSAYSEFEYAKQAISLGVSEYLVKPVDVGELRAAMGNIEEELAKEKLNRLGDPELLHSPEEILRGLFSGQLRMNEELTQFIEQTYGLKASSSVALFCIYLGKTYDAHAHLVANVVQSLMVRDRGPRDKILFFPQNNELVYVYTGPADTERFEKYCGTVMVREINKLSAVEAAFGFTRCQGFGALRHGLEQIHAWLPWNISLGRDCIISYPEITKIHPLVPAYPIQIEKDSIEALCAGDYNNLHSQTELFIRHFTGGQYNPESIKKCLIRYFLAIIQVVKEINFSAYETIDEQETLNRINAARTGAELQSALSGLLHGAAWRDAVDRHEKTPGLLVQKTLRLIAEYYRTGITLEEAAAALELSPEHISAQMVRELGVNFSTYVKNFRISRAKELLIGTGLKLYEIAGQVGYSDAKYFGRVFKEAEGMLPTEYRKRFK
jgi:two-component system response regulator YesN